MKHNEFSPVEEVTGDILKEKLLDLLAHGEGAGNGRAPICLITLPDGTHAQIGIYFKTESDPEIQL